MVSLNFTSLECILTLGGASDEDILGVSAGSGGGGPAAVHQPRVTRGTGHAHQIDWDEWKNTVGTE